MARLRDRVQRASDALATRSGAPVERAAQALVECVEQARDHCGRQEPPDPAMVACLSNGLYELVRHPTGRRLLGERAQPWLHDALATGRRLAAPRDRGYVVGQMALSLADLLRQDGELTRAAELVTEALATPAAPQLRPFLLALLADLRRGQGEPQAALQLCREGEACLLDRASRDPVPLHAWARHTLLAVEARVGLALGLPDQAYRQLAAARALAEGLDDEARFATTLLGCDVHLTANRPELAVAELTRAMGDERFTAQPTWQRVLRRRLGAARALSEIAVPRGRRVDAELVDGAPLLTAALADPGLEPAERLALELTMARLYAHRGDLEKAQEHATMAARLAHERPPDRHGPERAVLAALHCRLLSMRGAPAAELAAALRELETAHAAFLADWARTPIRAGGVGWLHYGQRREILGELLRTTLAVHGPEAGAARALDHLLAAQAMTSMARSLGVRAPGLERLRALLLRDGGGALIYLPTPDGTHVFTLDEGALYHQETVAPNALEPWRHRFIEGAARLPAAGAAPPPAEDQQAAGVELVRALLPEPVHARVLAWRTVALVGCDMLGPIPFEALPLGDGRLLGEAKAVYHLPSLPLACHLAAAAHLAPAARAEPGFDRDLLLAVASKTSPAGARLLPAAAPIRLSAAETAALLRPFAAARVHCVDAVGEGSLAAALRTRTRILQLFAHGLHDPTRELPSGLWLGADDKGDGLLWPEDVAALAPAPPLVILSACGSGAGPRRLGDDPLLHLGGAFLAHGTRCVVLSRQQVELGATLRLMAVAHARLAAGDCPAEAMRAARQELRTDPALRAPGYTCLLQVVGLGHEPVFTLRR